jgi:hypothetical protein
MAIVKLCLLIYCNETNLPWGNGTLTTKGLAHFNKGVMHPQNLETPFPNFKQLNPTPKPNLQNS